MNIIIKGKELEEYKNLEEAMSDYKETIKEYPSEEIFYFYTKMTFKEFKNEIIKEWNKIHKTNREENKSGIIKNTNNVKKEKQKNDNKPLQKNNLVEILAEPFKGQQATVIDISKELGTVYVKFNDSFENTWTLPIENVRIVKKEWKDIEIDKHFFKFIIKQDKILYMDKQSQKITDLKFDKKQVDFIINEFKKKENKVIEKIEHILNTSKSILATKNQIKIYQSNIQKLNHNIKFCNQRIENDCQTIDNFFKGINKNK